MLVLLQRALPATHQSKHEDVDVAGLERFGILRDDELEEQQLALAKAGGTYGAEKGGRLTIAQSWTMLDSR